MLSFNLLRSSKSVRLGVGAFAVVAAASVLGGCYGSYTYSYHDRYYEPCAPAHVVVRDSYCAPPPVVIVDHHHHGHYHGHRYHGGYRGGRRW